MMFFELGKKRLDFERVIGENLGFDASRPVDHSSFAISEEPQSRETQSRFEWQQRELFIEKKTRLENPRSCHLADPLSDGFVVFVALLPCSLGRASRHAFYARNARGLTCPFVRETQFVRNFPASTGDFALFFSVH